VSGPGDETVWTGDPRTITAALRALRARYRVVTRRAGSVRRTWLDSADLRLHRAGLALAEVSAAGAAGPGPAVLQLGGVDGGVLLALPDRDDVEGWPRLLDALPPELQEPLGPVLDIRALLPTVEHTVEVVAGTLQDDEGKTVVRLEQERPDRLRLVPVRGYRSDAAKAARLVRSAGLVPDPRSDYRVAQAAAGLDPDAVAEPAMRPELPATVAVARVLLGFLDELEAALAGTIADVDTEFLHDLRVAVRRSRSAVKLLADALPPRLVAWAAPQLKWLGDLTTPMRDLDVHLLGLPDAAARLRSGRPEDLEPLADHLGAIRVREQRALVRGLRSARFERFRSRWRAELEALAEAPTAPEEPEAAAETPEEAPVGTGPLAAEFGLAHLARAHRRLVKPGSRITPDSPAQDLHDLRKRGKELRYLLEIFGPLLEGDLGRRLVKELKGLQDVLGRFQDSEVQREAVVAMAEAMLAAGTAPVTTLLAMGEIAAGLHDDQLLAREEFAQRFERFAQVGGPAR